MVIECIRCWWDGLSSVPVFFDASNLLHHNRTIHPSSEYEVHEVIAAPWIAVGFTYQASFTESGDLVLVYPCSSKETGVSANSDHIRQGMDLPLAMPQRML